MLKKKPQLMIDTNVWLEYFTRSGQNPQAAKRLMEHAAEDHATLLYTPSTAKDVFYLLPRIMRRAASPADKDISFQPAAWAAITFMRDVATAGPLSAAECSLAAVMRTMFGDFEDNLIFACAETSECDFIVTHDQRFLERFPEVCITPKRAVELIELRC